MSVQCQVYLWYRMNFWPSEVKNMCKPKQNSKNKNKGFSVCVLLKLEVYGNADEWVTWLVSNEYVSEAGSTLAYTNEVPTILVTWVKSPSLSTGGTRTCLEYSWVNLAFVWRLSWVLVGLTRTTWPGCKLFPPRHLRLRLWIPRQFCPAFLTFYTTALFCFSFATTNITGRHISLYPDNIQNDNPEFASRTDVC